MVRCIFIFICINILFVYFTAKPASPSGQVRYSDITTDSVTVHWGKAKHDGGTALTGYVVERWDAKKPTFVHIAHCKGDRTCYTVNNLVNGCSYMFKVYAENQLGRSYALEAESAVTLPKLPSMFCFFN